MTDDEKNPPTGEEPTKPDPEELPDGSGHGSSDSEEDTASGGPA